MSEEMKVNEHTQANIYLSGVMSMLRRFDLIDEPRLIDLLKSGEALRARNFGQATYEKICQIMKVKPWEPPLSDSARAEKLRKQIKVRENQIKRFKAELSGIQGANPGQVQK